MSEQNKLATVCLRRTLSDACLLTLWQASCSYGSIKLTRTAFKTHT